MSLHKESGLTLLELVIVISILAIITTSAVAGFKDLITYTESQAATRELYRGFQFARSEAIKRQQTITICPLDNTGRCSNAWRKPISVFVDADQNRILQNARSLLHVIHPPSIGEYQAKPHSRRYFQFDSLGTSHGTIGNVTYCREEEGGTRPIQQLIMSMAGRVTFARDRDGDGVIEKNSGAPITCT